jgi:hypothetical protein
MGGPAAVGAVASSGPGATEATRCGVEEKSSPSFSTGGSVPLPKLSQAGSGWWAGFFFFSLHLSFDNSRKGVGGFCCFPVVLLAHQYYRLDSSLARPYNSTVTTTDHELKHWSGKHPVITSIVTFPLLILYAGMLLVGAGCVLVQNLWRPRA